MELLLINEQPEDNQIFAGNADCKENLQMTTDFYKRVGFNPPWVSYYAQQDDKLVGCAAFCGKPKNGRVEIAYGVFPQYQRQGIGTCIAKMLVDLAQQTDPSVAIVARTLKEHNFSTKILQKNHFKLTGTAIDDDEGEVWEWEYWPALPLL
jgi:ribosomal-protein-alanine N-acetyltransferase